jgi:hypothetical protein
MNPAINIIRKLQKEQKVKKEKRKRKRLSYSKKENRFIQM